MKGEKYVDFNGKTLNLLGYILCELQVGDAYTKKARVLIARSGAKSIIGRECFSSLRYTFAPVKELDVNSIKKTKN